MGADWKSVVRNVAPALGAALGGPGLGTAIKFVSTALLGKPDATEAEIARRVESWTAADEIALKQAEQAFVLALVDKAVQADQVDAADRANARAREIALRDWIPATLAVAIHLAFFSLLWAILRFPIPDANRSAFDILLGMLGTGIVAVWGYYFGSSSGSQTKTAVLGRLAEGRK